ncbi:protein YchT [Escherichia coli]
MLSKGVLSARLFNLIYV